MAYNNGFPMNYGYQMPQQQIIQTPQPSSNNNLVWVQGEAGAKSYLVAPNNTIPLWDSEAQVIYLKSADASGMPSMKVLDYTIRENAPAAHRAPIEDKTEYVTKTELEQLRAEITQKFEDIKESVGA